MSRSLGSVLLLCFAIYGLAPGPVTAAPDLANGLSTLFVLSDPYAANAGIWSTALDRRGYELTFAAVAETVSALGNARPPIPVDLTLDEVVDVAPFDALFLVSRSVDPTEIASVARDLRSSPVALDLSGMQTQRDWPCT